MQDESTLLTLHPAMFRNAPVGFVLLAIACLVGIGIPFMLVWWLKSRHTTLTITNRRSILQTGIFDRYSSEVMHDDVRNIQVGQTFAQRLLGVGTLAISSAGQAGVEIEVRGITDPEAVRETIDQYR